MVGWIPRLPALRREKVGQFIERVNKSQEFGVNDVPLILQYDERTGDMRPWAWPSVGGVPVRPDELDGHRYTHYFRAPHCPCSFMTDLSSFQEAKIGLAQVVMEPVNAQCLGHHSDPCSTAPPLAVSAPIARAFATTTTDYKKYGNPNARTPASTALEREAALKKKKSRIADARKAKEERNRTLFSKVTMEEVVDPDAPLPRNIREALGGPESKEWLGAVQEELGTLKKMGTWELKDLPEGRDAVGCKWVFTRKKDEKGQVVRHKARLVAQGFSQKPGMDFDLDGTFAPVMRLETLRSVLALATILRLHVFQLDFKNAYLNGKLNRPIYMRQPDGFDDGSGRVSQIGLLLLYSTP
ncbi:hypothetical protein NMY22_g16757 [Coprinellus aureogranulatus]|nr:hypothetical protein NMY22_g16757 [Coprinellus aureogranulatus]